MNILSQYFKRQNLVVVIATIVLSLVSAGEAASTSINESIAMRMPKDVYPVLGCWFWTEDEIKPEGYRAYIDMVGKHAAYDYLTTSLRIRNWEITDSYIHDQIRHATEYARQRGIGIAMDLDVRLARKDFQKRYPDEMQEMLRLREVNLCNTGTIETQITSAALGDHYTYNATPYIPLSGRLERVYVYKSAQGGIVPGTIEDITARCTVAEANPRDIRVIIPCDAKTDGKKACVMATFTHLTPDVFAPHLLKYQRELLRQYADIKLSGACKDEWGFPPCYDGNPAKNDFWFSRHHAAEYAKQTAGRDMVRDALLMYLGEIGREKERQSVINHFFAIILERNKVIETDFYNDVKKIWGSNAIVATHPTWFSFPDSREYKKNSLDWWVAKRDWAQTDERSPFCIRTSLAKKWNSGVWYNMYYSSIIEDYPISLWSYTLASGRVNYHPIYPPGCDITSMKPLLRDSLMRGDCRVRLLNFISKSPLDCSVAVIFGHANAMNWAGKNYEDVGLKFTDNFWQNGYPADLIPSTEVKDNQLAISSDNYIQYGPQKYKAVVLYHPEFEGPQLASFFQKAKNCKTALYKIGDWTTDFNGKSIDLIKMLPERMTAYSDANLCMNSVIENLHKNGISEQTRCNDWMVFEDGNRTIRPPTSGRCRLIDGTEIIIAGTKDVAGDPIDVKFEIDGFEISAKAIGVLAVRLDAKGKLDALAAGGLRSFHGAGMNIELEESIDLALWKDNRGKMAGVVQGFKNEIPEALNAITKEWESIDIPSPLRN
jgi:hypothetical protein